MSESLKRASSTPATACSSLTLNLAPNRVQQQFLMLLWKVTNSGLSSWFPAKGNLTRTFLPVRDSQEMTIMPLTSPNSRKLAPRSCTIMLKSLRSKLARSRIKKKANKFWKSGNLILTRSVFSLQGKPQKNHSKSTLSSVTRLIISRWWDLCQGTTHSKDLTLNRTSPTQALGRKPSLMPCSTRGMLPINN